MSDEQVPIKEGYARANKSQKDLKRIIDTNQDYLERSYASNAVDELRLALDELAFVFAHLGRDEISKENAAHVNGLQTTTVMKFKKVIKRCQKGFDKAKSKAIVEDIKTALKPTLEPTYTHKPLNPNSP